MAHKEHRLNMVLYNSANYYQPCRIISIFTNLSSVKVSHILTADRKLESSKSFFYTEPQKKATHTLLVRLPLKIFTSDVVILKNIPLCHLFQVCINFRRSKQSHTISHRHYTNATLSWPFLQMAMVPPNICYWVQFICRLRNSEHLSSHVSSFKILTVFCSCSVPILSDRCRQVQFSNAKKCALTSNPNKIYFP